MATIRKRNGKYQVQVRRKGFAPIARSFLKRGDAEEWARFNETKADRGELPISSKSLDKFTFGEILKRYRDEISVKKRSHNTEIYILNAAMRLPMAKLSLDRLSPAMFSAYREKRLKTVKPGTVNREFGILKHALDVAAYQWDVPIRNNPLNRLKKLKVQDARTRRLLPGEWDKLCEAAQISRQENLMLLIKLALETAMRRGELLRIRWSDIKLDARTLYIPITKNGHSRRIPLSSEAVNILTSLNEARLADKYVFDWTDNAAKLAWQRLTERAEIEDLHFHDLRHEAVSRLFEKGLSIPEVALISGHRDFKMLFRYTHLKAEDIVSKLQ